MRMSWILQRCRPSEVYHQKMLYLDNTLGYVSGLKIKDGEYLILVSYNKQQQAMPNYKQRWQIETMFQAFRTKGLVLKTLI